MIILTFVTNIAQFHPILSRNQFSNQLKLLSSRIRSYQPSCQLKAKVNLANPDVSFQFLTWIWAETVLSSIRSWERHRCSKLWSRLDVVAAVVVVAVAASPSPEINSTLATREVFHVFLHLPTSQLVSSVDLWLTIKTTVIEEVLFRMLRVHYFS